MIGLPTIEIFIRDIGRVRINPRGITIIILISPCHGFIKVVPSYASE